MAWGARLAVCGAVLAGALVVPGGAAPAVAAPGPDRPDFDGDGHADLVVGVIGERSGRSGPPAGAVQVVYGDGDGLSGRDAVVAQGSEGPVAEAGDQYGIAIATGDFDDDGFDDLAIGAPGDAHLFAVRFDGRGPGRATASSDVVVLAPSRGLVALWSGSAGGLVEGGTLTQNTPGVYGHAEDGDSFGAAVAAGDLDGDGVDDLAIGAPGEGVAGKSSAGVVHVLWGVEDDGLTAAGNRMLMQGGPLGGALEATDAFGSALAVGALGAGPGPADLVIGAPAETVGDARAAGAVFAVTGEADRNLDAAVILHQDVPGVTGGAETADLFGAALAVGDHDGDGDGELAVGVPSENIDGNPLAGAVHVFQGSVTGISTAQEALWEGRGVGGTPGNGDQFGAALAFGDLDLDGAADLAVGGPGEDAGRGAVHVLPGEGVVPADPPTRWTQGPGLQGSPEEGDTFGTALATADYTGDGVPDLSVGAPFEDIGATEAAGAVSIIRGSATGLVAAGDILLHQASPGMTGHPEQGDLFGAPLG